MNTLIPDGINETLSLSDAFARLPAPPENWSQAVVLHDGARMHPTFCLLRTRLAGYAEAWLRAGNSALHRWIGSLDARMLDTDVPPNVNTPGELAALESSHTPT